MAAIVCGTVPASEFALHNVLESNPDIRFEVERIIESGNGTVMPLIRVRGTDRSRIENALEEDPSVTDVRLLEAFDEEFLFQMKWSQWVDLLLQMITSWGAMILDACGSGDRWQLRVLYPDHTHVSATHEFCEEHGLNFNVESVHEFDSEPAGRYGLTEKQYQALVLAVKRGYYAIPQKATLDELAEEAGISHQALSERLRRGTQRLVQDTLLIGSSEE